IPVAFVYGKNDTVGAARALGNIKAIKPNFKRGEKPRDNDPLKLTGEYAVEKTKLVGHKLLDKSSSDAVQWITEEYLGKGVFGKDTPNQWEKRESDTFGFAWSFPRANFVLAKHAKDKLPQPAPINYLLPR